MAAHRTAPSRNRLRAVALLLATAGFGQTAQVPANQPVARTDRNSQIAHEQLLAKRTSGRIDAYFLGDSITRRWGALDYPDLLAHWRRRFFGWNAANFGWGGDTTQNVLWRLANGELDDVHPKVVVLLAGTNNVSTADTARADAAAANIAAGVSAIVAQVRAKAPRAVIVLTAIFPRSDNPSLMPVIDRINQMLTGLADGRTIRLLNVNGQLLDGAGRLRAGMMNADGLHPALPTYEIWADALRPIFLEVLGPPGAVDQAPPATGNPGA
jgi:lysophospholipase L1-like esterase